MVSDSGSELDPQRVAAWATRLDLPAQTVQSLCRVHAPLSDWVAARQRKLGRPMLLGINGAQGTGKSTLLWLMLRLLAERHGLSASGCSLDDLYLTAQERRTLAGRIHPLLAVRGVPGTHDIALGQRTFDALLHGQVGRHAIPCFDKAADDRLPTDRWPTVAAPVDVAILEGWCVGARAQSPAELARPCNALERERDPDGSYRQYVNEQLQGPYGAFFERLDALIMLKAPDLACVRRWRREQEEALARKLRRAGRPDTTMDRAQVDRFVEHFDRLTVAMLAEMPARADVVIEMDPDHSLVAVAYRSAEGQP